MPNMCPRHATGVISISLGGTPAVVIDYSKGRSESSRVSQAYKVVCAANLVEYRRLVVLPLEPCVVCKVIGYTISLRAFVVSRKRVSRTDGVLYKRI